MAEGCFNGRSMSRDLLDFVGVGLAEVLPDGQLLRANAPLCAMLGHPREVLLTLNFEDLLCPGEPRLNAGELITLSREANTPALRTRRLRTSNGAAVWAELSASETMPSLHRSAYLVTFVDVTRRIILETKLADSELRKVEFRSELTHRLRNVFPIVLMIVKMTAERYPSAAEYCRALERRLRALAAAEDLMRTAESGSMTLEGLLRTELMPFQDSAHILMQGPAVALRGAVAQCFVILVHELTTNAVKYGSLGAANGMLIVRWQFVRGPKGERLLRFQWRERRGPQVPQTRVQGFGASVISQSGELLGGTARADYGSEGLSYHLEFPLDRTQSASDSGWIKPLSA